MSKRSSILENPRGGRKKRQTDSLPTPLRRSQRLSSKYSIPLTDSAYSRSSLGQYVEESYLNDTTSVLNESGQSVPIDFDQDNDSVLHDHNYSSRGTSTNHTQPHSRRSHYNPPIPEDTRESTPQYYGLDGNEDELNELYSRHSHDYDLYTRERILTPPKPKPPINTGPSLCTRVINGIGGFFYSLGSFLYLFFAVVVLCDIPIFSRGASAFSRHTKSSCQSLMLFVTLFGVVFIVSAVPHIKYTLPATPTTLPSAPPPIVSTVTTVVSPSPDSAPHQGLLEAINALRADFNTYKHEQESVIHHLKMLVEDSYAESADELSTFRGTFESIVSKSVESEAVNRKAMMKEMKAGLLAKMEQELTNSSQSLDTKLEQLLEESTKRATEAGTIDESTVRHIAKGLVKEAVSELNSSLEGIIGHMDTSLAQLKGELATDLRSASEEWRAKLVELEDKLSEKMKDNQHMVDGIKNSIDQQQSSHDDDIKKLQDQLSDLSVKITNIEQNIINLETKEWPIPNTTTDDITEDQVLQLITKTLHNYSADQIARFDYALESAGGAVVDNSETFDPSHTKAQLFGYTLPLTLSRMPPEAVIQPAVLPGDCWCFKGATGYIVVKLANTAVVDGVTVQHIPKVLSPSGSIASAINTFTVKGLSSPGDEGSELGSFQYNDQLPPIQSFDIKHNKKVFSYVRFDVTGNHGNTDYTCVYRLRVHGAPPTN